jgi:flagellar basal-body rod protein FlgB
MSIGIETRMGEQVSRYLDLATSEAKITVANMANIDTPGYRALGMDFQAVMRQAINTVDDGESSQPVQVRLEEGLIARPDGNNVSMDREGLTLAEAQLKFKTGVALLRVEYQRVLSAIRIDKN